MRSVFTQLKPELRDAIIKYNNDKDQLYNNEINIMTKEESYPRLPYSVFVFLQLVCSQKLNMNLKDFTFFYQMLE